MGQYKDNMRKTAERDKQCRHCTVAALPGSDFCPAHGGHKGHQAALEQERRIYRINKYKSRMGELIEHPEARSFREEVAQLRTLLEVIWNSCNDEHDLILKTPQIVQITDKITNALVSVEKLDREIGRTKTEDDLAVLFDAIKDVLSAHVDEDTLTNIIQDLEEIDL